MLTTEHVQIYSGKKLILQGNYWIPLVGRCGICGDVNKLEDDRYCVECLKEEGQ